MEQLDSYTIFRKPNQMICREPFHIAKIQDMLINIEGLNHASSFDLNMGYYNIELPPGEKKLCTIITPWVNYEHQKLPMGV